MGWEHKGLEIPWVTEDTFRLISWRCFVTISEFPLTRDPLGEATITLQNSSDVRKGWGLKMYPGQSWRREKIIICFELSNKSPGQ